MHFGLEDFLNTISSHCFLKGLIISLGATMATMATLRLRCSKKEAKAFHFCSFKPILTLLRKAHLNLSFQTFSVAPSVVQRSCYISRIVVQFCCLGSWVTGALVTIGYHIPLIEIREDNHKQLES